MDNTSKQMQDNRQARLTQIEQVIARGPYSASWDSLEQAEIPAWYQDAKFGIFIHWGLYSVPAFGNEWYPRNMYRAGTPEFQHHVATYGPQDKFGYKDFIPLFRAERFDPADWAKLFREAGARFVMPVAEHHDGFQMYGSEWSRWNAVEMGPGRDVLGELREAVEAEGMEICASSHRAEHWWFLGEGRNFDSDVNDPAFADFYGPAHGTLGPEFHWDNYLSNPPDEAYLEDWLVRTCEIIDKYRPKVLWFDWWIMNLAFKPYLKKLAAYYYNRAAEWGCAVAINHKFDAFPVRTAVFDVERGQLSGIRGLFWQTDTAVQKNSWGYTENQDYKSAVDIIGDLVDIVSKNGALLLNVARRPTAPSRSLSGGFSGKSAPGWPPMARPSTARVPGRCLGKAPPGWRRVRSRTRHGRHLPRRTSGSPPKGRICSPWCCAVRKMAPWPSLPLAPPVRWAQPPGQDGWRPSRCSMATGRSRSRKREPH
jgi:alpha-L-fucosidase